MRHPEMKSSRVRTLVLLLLGGALVVALGACGGASETGSVVELEAAAESAAERARIEARERELEEQQRRLDERQAMLDERQALAAEQAEIEANRQRLATEEQAAAERHARELEEAEAARRQIAELEAQAAAAAEALRQRESESEPEPVFVDASLAAGTILEIEIEETLSSRTSQVGDSFSSRITRDLYSEDGILVVPAGSQLTGRVTEAKPLKRVGGQASLGLEFTHLVLSSGTTTEIRASFAEQGTNQRSDKKKIAVAAAAGAILGRILGDKGGGSATALGAAIGAAAGTAVVARKKGEDVEIPAGQIIALRLEEVVTVTTRMTGLVEN